MYKKISIYKPIEWTSQDFDNRTDWQDVSLETVKSELAGEYDIEQALYCLCQGMLIHTSKAVYKWEFD